jgi:hypothetical protein
LKLNSEEFLAVCSIKGLSTRLMKGKDSGGDRSADEQGGGEVEHGERLPLPTLERDWARDA